MKPRDTRLGSGRRARVRVVAPPQWLPWRPDHDAFRTRYALRPTTVWLGTSDGLLHGFNAVSGNELAAFLPGAMLAGAAQAAEAGVPVVRPPCPRPEAADVRIDNAWRTVLLCGSPAQDGMAASVFALDITELGSTDAPALRLLWALSADASLPLAPSGPVRAVELDDHGERRWYAVTTVGRGTAPALSSATPPQISTPPGLALIPLDKPPHAPWRDRYAVVRLPLPALGCGGSQPTSLLAATVQTDWLHTGTSAAYAVDAGGRLWRFALGAALSGADVARQAACLHAPAPPVEKHEPEREPRDAYDTEPPHIAGTAGGALVIFGAGNNLTGIIDDGTSTASGAPPRLVAAEPAADGVILRAVPDPSGAAASAGGWRIALPGSNERLDEILDAGTGYLAFVTRTADDQLHGYLIRAASGESVMQERAGSVAAATVTGRPLGVAGTTTVIVRREPLGPQSGPESSAMAGQTGRTAFDISLWAIDGSVAKLAAHTLASRRIGRLGWRELMLPASPGGSQ